MKFLQITFVAFFSLFLALGSTDSLQLVAWTGMLMSFAKTESIQEAVSKTFDGQHPCDLCETLEEARKTAEQSPGTPAEKRENNPQRVDLLQPQPIDLASRKFTRVLDGPRGSAALLRNREICLSVVSPPPRALA